MIIFLGSESELKTPESKPKGKPGRKRRTPSTSVDEVVETKRRTLRELPFAYHHDNCRF